MKTLSLLQPWASLVAIGGSPYPQIAASAKRIETRSYRTNYRGPLLIHASSRLPKEAGKALVYPRFWEALWFAGIRQIEDYPTGSILCLVDLVDVVQITADNAPPEPELSFGDYTPGRYAWHLANVRRLESPVPAKGRLGLWTPDPETLAAVMAQLLEVPPC